MKPDPLDRLLKNAALAQREERIELSFPAQARILAAWRAAHTESEALLPLLRKAVLAACAVTALAVALTTFTIEPERTAVPETDEIAALATSLDEAIEIAWTE